MENEKIKLEHVSENDFEKTLIEFPKDQHDLAEYLHKLIPSGYNYGPIIVSQDKKDLMFCVNMELNNREKRENMNRSYRVRIEKI